MKNFLIKNNYLLCFIAFSGYQLIFYKYGLNLWDEGGLAYGSLRVLNGEIPLVDFGFDGYPPGRYFLAALFFKIFGIHLGSIRLLFVALTSLMAILFYRVSREIMDKNFSIISTLLLISAPSMYYNRLFPICAVINIYFISRYISSERKFDLALSAIIVLLTFLFKVEIAVISLFILLLVFVFHIFFKGITFPFNTGKVFHSYKFPLLMIGVLVVGTFVAAIKINLPMKVYKFVFQMDSLWGNPFPSFFSPQGMDSLPFPEIFNISLYYIPIIVYVAVLILLFKGIIFSVKKATFDKCDLQVLTVLLFGMGMYGLVIWRAGFDNLLRVLPPFYILLCYLLYLCYKKIIASQTNTDRVSAKSSIKNFALSVPILFFPALFIVNLNFHHGFYAGSIGELRNPHTYLNINRAKIYADPREAVWINEVVSYIKETTTEDEPIFVLPLNPIWYFFSERNNATSYDWILPQTIKILGEEQKIIDQLKENVPKLIIYADIAIDGKEERRLSNYAPKVYSFIEDNYQLEKYSGPFQILKKT